MKLIRNKNRYYRDFVQYDRNDSFIPISQILCVEEFPEAGSEVEFDLLHFSLNRPQRERADLIIKNEGTTKVKVKLNYIYERSCEIQYGDEPREIFEVSYNALNVINE